MLLPGQELDLEAELIKMFVHSLCSTVTRLQTVEPFAALFSLAERPLHAVVPWAHADVSEDDHGLIQELSTHVAGAVLTAPD
jgi:hypothetical protein